MKTKIILVLALFLSLYSFGQTLGQTFAIDGINYQITKATAPYEVAVGSNTTFVGAATIPVSVTNAGNLFAVTSIDGAAFEGCSGLTSVIIPNSVTTIGFAVFIDCSNLTSVIISNSMTFIHSSTFERCSRLTSVTIPTSVTIIGNNAFADCSSLTAITIPNSVTSIAQGAFLRCISLTTVAIPNSVTSIGYSVFTDCSSLVSVTISSSVTSIAGDTFRRCTSLMSVDIPNSVTNIGSYAFADCSSLTSVTIPNSVTSIADYTFARCARLSAVDIPNSVKSIGFNAFENCSGLRSIIIPNSVTSIGGSAFANCSSLIAVTIPNSVINLGNAGNAFADCSSLTSVTIPNSVRDIARNTFLRCTSLTAVDIPNSVGYIGENAFADCSSLTTVTIPNSVREIADNAFSRCSGLTSVTVNLVNPLAVNSNVFSGVNLSLVRLNVPAGRVVTYDAAQVWTNFNPIVEAVVPLALNETFAANGISYIITKATLPYEVAVSNNPTFMGVATIPTIVTNAGNSFAVTSIAENAFLRCRSLTSVTIPNSVTSIGNSAFSNCSGLISLTIGNSVTSIGQEAFSECTGLTSVGIPNSVTNLGNASFSSCTSLTSVIIPNSVTSIGAGVFASCIRLPSVTIPNSITSISRGMFSNCTGLRSVTIPNTVTSIGEKAFSDSGITSITIPNAVTNIDNSAFYRCRSLTSVTIPNAVTSIGAEAFSFCSSLTSVSISNSITVIAYGTFLGCTSLTSVSIPNSVTSIGDIAFSSCSALSSINIPSSVTSISGGAFAYCTGLSEVYVNWINPLAISSTVFQDVAISTIILKVPVGQVAVYESDVFWTKFNLIIAPVLAPVLGQTFASNGINYVITKAILPYEVAVTNNANFVGAATLPARVFNAGNAFAVTSIEDYAFIRCLGLSSITIPTSLTSIGTGVFADCSSLASVTIPNSVTSIATNAFIRCTGLTSVRIPNSVTSIGSSAFADCSSLTRITIPNSVTSIAEYTFLRCSGLISVGIPNSLIGIGIGAFADCSRLTSITIPNSVTNIAEDTFLRCTGLTEVTVNWITPLSISATVFSGLNLFTKTLNVPAGTLAAYDAAAVWTNFGTFTEFSLYTAIPDEAFEQALFDEGIDTVNGDHQVLTSAIINLKQLDLNYRDINDLTGIQDFTNLEVLRCNQNQLFDLNVSALTNLETLECDDNQLFELNLSGLWSLQTLNCNNNQLNNINLSGLNSLQTLNISGNQLINIDLSELASLQYLDCRGNQLDNIDLSGLTSLQSFSCNENYLSELNVNGLSNLRDLNCAYNQLTDIDLSGISSLQSFACDANQITNLNLSGLTSLNQFSSNLNPLTYLNVDGLTALGFLFVEGSQLTSLDLRGLTNLTNFRSVSNPLLSCISVDNVAFATSNYEKEATTSFSTNCFFGPITITYCKGAVATPLTFNVLVTSTLKWYTVATGGTASLVAPTPTTTIVGTKLYYVSQTVGGIESARITVTVNTIALPATPGTITGTAAQGALVGTTTTATYTIAEVVNATSYAWTAPGGVNIMAGQGTNTVTVNFNDVPAGAGAIGNLSVVAVNSNDCRSLVRNLALTKALPSAPTAIKMTDATLPIPVSGIPTTVTSFAKHMGTSSILTITAAPVATATSYEWELPTGVTQLSGGTTNVITVDFSGVTSSNTFSYDVVNTVTAVVTPTNVLRIGVRAKNGTGYSVTANTTAFNPGTTSTAKLLTLKAILPAAPSAIKMTNPLLPIPVSGIPTGVTVISKYIGTSTEFTLTATPSPLASSFTWELPAGVTQLSGGNTNVITVNFAGVVAGVTSLYIGVKAVNGIGSSIKDNTLLVPATSSTAKVLKLTATVPAAVTKVAGQIVGLCGNGNDFYSYTITPSLLANSYVITAPTGSVVRSISTMANATNILSTADLTFTVIYPTGFVASTASPKAISIAAVNGVGASLTSKSIALSTASTALPAIGLVTGGSTFKRCNTQLFSIPTVVGATGYIWTVVDGAVIVSGQGTNSVVVDFTAVSVLKTTNLLKVAATNSCGVSASVKSITLTSSACPPPPPGLTRIASTNTFTVSATEVYPNPVSDSFSIDVIASKRGILEITIYSLDGTIAANPRTVQLQEGNNTIDENISSLTRGVYVVHLTNSSNNEVIIKKLIKE